MSNPLITIKVKRNRRSKCGCPRGYIADVETHDGMGGGIEYRVYGKNPRQALRSAIEENWPQLLTNGEPR